MGVWASARGVLKSLSMSSDVRDAGLRAMKLNPRVECGGPYRLVGRYYNKLPGMFSGDNAKSLKLLQKGVSLCPANKLGKLYLAEVLHDLDRHAETRQHLEKIIAEHRFVVKQAKSLLTEWEY